MIRSFRPDDMEVIEKIHNKYYAKEFDLPDFIHNFLCSFTIVDRGEIVSVGGVRTITESVVITDKDKSVRARYHALNEILQASMFTCGRTGYDQICATVINDPKWKLHLSKVGFKPVKGDMLVLSL